MPFVNTSLIRNFGFESFLSLKICKYLGLFVIQICTVPSYRLVKVAQRTAVWMSEIRLQKKIYVDSLRCSLRSYSSSASQYFAYPFNFNVAQRRCDCDLRRNTTGDCKHLLGEKERRELNMMPFEIVWRFRKYLTVWNLRNVGGLACIVWKCVFCRNFL